MERIFAWRERPLQGLQEEEKTLCLMIKRNATGITVVDDEKKLADRSKGVTLQRCLDVSTLVVHVPCYRGR